MFFTGLINPEKFINNEAVIVSFGPFTITIKPNLLTLTIMFTSDDFKNFQTFELLSTTNTQNKWWYFIIHNDAKMDKISLLVDRKYLYVTDDLPVKNSRFYNISSNKITASAIFKFLRVWSSNIITLANIRYFYNK